MYIYICFYIIIYYKFKRREYRRGERGKKEEREERERE